MKKIISLKKTIIFILLVALILPTPTFASENLFYYFDNINGLNSFRKNVKEIDIVAPQVYEVGYDLKVSTPNSNQKRLLHEAKNRDSQVMPLLVNKSFDKVLMSDILINQKAQDEIIDFLITEAKKQKYIGWQFDFENINHLDRAMYTAFVKKTYQKFQAEGLQLSVAVVVRSNDYDVNSKNQDWSSAYEYKQLSVASDFLTLMTYDDPGSNGPTASLAYVKNILDYMLTQVPADKLSLGIPAYCWQWQDGKKVASTTYKLAQKAYNAANKKTKSKGFDEDLGSAYFKFMRDGVQNVIWCDDAQSFEIKDQLIADKGLRGFSMWALGQEDSNVWKYLKNK
jgi:spore germination protein YaaH